MDIFNRMNIFSNYKDVSNEQDLENTAFQKSRAKTEDLEKEDLENSSRKNTENTENTEDSENNDTEDTENTEDSENNDNDDNDDNSNQVIDVIVLNSDVLNSDIKSESNDNNSDTSDSSSDTEVKKRKELIDVNNDQTGGIIYDILHIFDDIYVYGRTLIENNYFNLSENDEFNLVYPNIYIGNYSTSTNLKLLKDLGITHIVSVIPSFNPPFLDKFKYLHIQAYDDESQDITQYFELSNEFISKCLNEGGKVLIHCMVGRSRSVSICMAFLIHIIQGHFHKKSLNLDNYNDNYNNNNDDDIYNSVEYNKFIKINNNTKKKVSYNETNYNHEKINTTEHIKPNLSNKEKNYIVYKKEVMLNEIDELINTYTLLKKEINIKKRYDNSECSDEVSDNNTSYKTIDELNKIIKNMKDQSGKHFIIQLLKYIKKYRSCAEPNPYFIKQLSESIF